jgi:hypothetical protein
MLMKPTQMADEANRCDAMAHEIPIHATRWPVKPIRCPTMHRETNRCPTMHHERGLKKIPRAKRSVKQSHSEITTSGLVSREAAKKD